MHVENKVMPDREQMAGFAQAGPEGPIYMVNLLKFKDKAEYPDGRATDLSGRDAYRIYGEAVSQLLKKFGGKATFLADVSRLTLGEVEELWDEVAIAMYPSRKHMLEMMMSEEMQAIGVHRTAGLAGQLNIETSMADPGWIDSQ